MIRFATAEDGLAMQRIYAQYIETAITFEDTLPTGEACSRRIIQTMEMYPFLICEEEGRVMGYACAHRYQERAAYGWNAELSVYIDKACTAKGLGRRLYQALMAILKLQGVKTVYGLVTVPNEKSERLHASLGFARVGTYHSTGYQCGKWHDVALFEKAIAAYDSAPAPVIPITQLPQEALEAVLREQVCN